MVSDHNNLMRRITSGQYRLAWAFLSLSLTLIVPTPAFAAMPRLKISENHRFLVQEDGSPFFYLGDTAWELFHRLNREDADRYLKDRAKKGFTVVQAVALAEIDGLNSPNPYGYRPLVDNDVTKPDVKEGPANDYWDNVDYIVDRANALGIYIGFLPTWGDKWNRKPGAGGSFTAESAATYGQWLGRRYKDKGIIWILGGDRPVENEEHRRILRALAQGLTEGDGGAHLKTFHPPGNNGSSTWWQNDAWLDFNLRQNGHGAEYNGGHYDATLADYRRTPTKPVIDGEPIYEDHPVSFDPGKFGHSTAADVRHALYWDLFSGACGHTYGHHSVWQMWAPPREPVNNPLMPWFEAIDQPGAGQMQYGKKLLQSRPILSRIPDDSVIVAERVPTSVPGAGRYRFVATRDELGSYAMVYAPIGRKFKVRMSKITGASVVAWWFNPRTGEATRIGKFPNIGEREFLSPNPGEQIDWVLVLDDAAKRYPVPGTKK